MVAVAVAEAGTCLPKMAIHSVCITAPSQSVASLQIYNTCEEDVGCLAAIAYRNIFGR